eukprot:TRINITY_DN9545_c0_g1_i1.p1 TRINITY_DN9545_c0_g1~~TRINITY_DN9545_c0_g1_i1.p1  ORF type:complete len:147 (+),score=20.34 TRINITY_DN9545_c0_g1_i1:250-690(+)
MDALDDTYMALKSEEQLGECRTKEIGWGAYNPAYFGTNLPKGSHLHLPYEQNRNAKHGLSHDEVERELYISKILPSRAIHGTERPTTVAEQNAQNRPPPRQNTARQNSAGGGGGNKGKVEFHDNASVVSHSSSSTVNKSVSSRQQK